MDGELRLNGKRLIFVVSDLRKCLKQEWPRLDFGFHNPIYAQAEDRAAKEHEKATFWEFETFGVISKSDQQSITESQPCKFEITDKAGNVLRPLFGSIASSKYGENSQGLFIFAELPQ